MSRPPSTASRRSTPGVFEALTSPGASVEGTIVPRLGAALAAVDRAAGAGPGRPASAPRPRMLLTRWPRSRDTFATARSSPCRRAARPRCRWARCGRGGWSWSSGPRTCAGQPSRRASCCGRPAWSCRMPRSPSSPSTPRAGRAGLYLAALSIRARGAKGKPAAALLRQRRPGVGLPAVGAARPAFRGRAPLPHADLRARAAVGAAVRRGAGGERIGVDAGVAGALQPVPGAAGPVPASGTAITTSSRNCSDPSCREPSPISCPACWPGQRTGARRTGTPSGRSGTRSRPATSTAWRRWSGSAFRPRTRAAA